MASDDTRVDLAGRDLTSLSGLEIASNTQWLDLSLNALTSLDSLPALPALRELLLNRNLLHRLNGIERAPVVHTLSISFNPVEDLAPLAGLAKLRQLYARSVPYRSLTPLTELQIETLTITVYAAEDLDPLHSISSLRELHLSGAGLTRLASVPCLAQLRSLSLTHCPELTDISWLRGAKRLERLSLAFTGVMELWALAELPLQSLSLQGTPAVSQLPAWTAHIAELRLS